MATAAKSSFGTYLKIGDGASSEVFTTIAEVLDIDGPDMGLSVEEVTSHSSTDGWVERIGTLLDAGNVSFEMNWLPANTTQSFTTAGLGKDMNDKRARNFQLVVPAAATLTWAFTALVTKFKPNLKVKGAQRASIELTLTGKPTLS